LLIALPHGVTFGFLAAAHRVTHDDQRVQIENYVLDDLASAIAAAKAKLDSLR